MIDQDCLIKAFRLMCMARSMAALYESNRQLCPYVHSVSSGHEAIQLATAFQLLPCDFVSPYYRDESMLLGLGFTPYQLMLQLLAKKDDPFSGGRAYYSHPNYKGQDKPQIIHQSSATGMQAIPSTGIAQGLAFLEKIQSPLLRKGPGGQSPLVVCSLGDASMTEGEVSEALQFAALKQLPIIYLVQDNDWGISVTASEARAMDAYEYAAGFKGLGRMRVDGADFEASYGAVETVMDFVRQHRRPFLLQAKLPLLGHHTSGVRREFYRTPEDLDEHGRLDPLGRLKKRVLDTGISTEILADIEKETADAAAAQFREALAAPDPDPATVQDFVYVPTPVAAEKGNRAPADARSVLMVDAALYAIREIMEDCPEALVYGQDVGRRLGGVFRETATLAAQFGDHRVFNTAIQEAYIIGSTVGMSATGARPIVEVQFADYIFPGFNQLVTELAKSSFLSMGKFPVTAVIRVPVGAYLGGGPYHSASIESTLLSIKGIKIACPSNAADMKGLMKAAFLDPNPVIMLEHKGLYWCKVPGTEEARRPEPSRDYVLPLGRAAIVHHAAQDRIDRGETVCIITYGMGVYWALALREKFAGQLEIIDLRTLFPLDEELVMDRVKCHGKCLVLTEEQQSNSFAEALAGRISAQCFRYLDAPVFVLGALNLPAVPLNIGLEKAMLPNPEKLAEKLTELLGY